MVEGFHRRFKSRVNRPKPTVQEYFRAIREQQVITDYHIDRLGVGKTPSNKRVSSNYHYLKNIFVRISVYKRNLINLYTAQL